MKKSLFTLFTGLIIGGLLIIGSTNAMTYTVQGNSTTIAIPNSIKGTSIKRCDDCNTTTIIKNSEECGDNKCCERTINTRVYVECKHNYGTEGTYTVDFNGLNKDFDNLYLDNANIKNIVNFGNINTITNLYLGSNTGIALQSNTFSSIPIANIYLNGNNLSTFNTSIPSNTMGLYLYSNLLTTIPENIRNLSNNYKIKLSEDISYNPGNINTKIIDLSDNPIKYIKITKVDNTDRKLVSEPYEFRNPTTYNFERFGYHFYDNDIIAGRTDPSKIWYSYEISGYDVNYVHGNVIQNVNNGSTTEPLIDPPMEPGNYIFKVCLIGDENICDSIDFTVTYDEEIKIIEPNDNDNYDSLNIQAQRGRSGNYPYNLYVEGGPYLSGYKYEIKKEDNLIYEGFAGLYSDDSPWFNEIDCPNSYYSYICISPIDIGNIITESVNEDPNGNYKLTVKLINYEGTVITETETNFTINIDTTLPSLTIDEPNNEVSSQNIYFKWHPDFPNSNPYHNYTLNHYEYSVTGPQGYSTGKDNYLGTEFQLKNLADGQYTFTVEMYYNDNGTIVQEPITSTKSFSMHALEAPHVSITSPENGSGITENNVSIINIPFSWSGGATLFNRYHYTIKNSSEYELTSGDVTINNSNTRQFTYSLGNGTYTFEVKMYDSNNNEIASDTSTFTVEIPTTLNIISPTNGDHSSATTTFNWEGFTPYELTNYEYTITGQNGFSTGNTTSDTSFSLQNLRDGSYTFSLTMNYKEGSTPKAITKTRDFNINSSAGANIEITSPNKPIYTGNYIKTVPINFTWNGGGSPLISKYSYKLTNTTNNEIIASSYVNKNEAGTYSIEPISLPSGTYNFEVSMLDSDNEPITTKSYPFNIVIPSYLEIETPPEGQLNIKNVDFIWSGFAEFQNHYKYELKRIDSSSNGILITGNSNTQINNFSLQNLHNGKYTFTVSIMNSENIEIISRSRTFRIPDDLDLVLDISDGNSSVTTLRARKGIFSRGGRSEDFARYSYSIQGTTFNNETYLYTGKSEGTTGSITLNDLSTGIYKFHVNMLNASGGVITGKYIDFNVAIPASLKITSPTSGSTVSSSSATFKWDGYSDVITRYEYSLTSSGGYSNNGFTTASSFNRNDLTNGNYTLVVRLASGTNIVAQDTVHFTVSIPKKTGGGGGGSSSKSHPTNDLSVSITNDEPTTNERVEVVVDVNDKYTGKVDFTKMQYYSFDEEKRIDIPVTSKNYIKDFSDDAKLGYIKFDSSDDGEKNLSEFLMFSQPGNYRIHVEDKDGYKEYTEFYVGKGNNKTQLTTTREKETAPEDEYYIARSCKKYKIEYLDDLGVYTSPNLKKDEYFINKDYFKRYIDSKNKQINGCPTNVGWISTTYKDNSNSSDKYAAPNGKVYFINGENGVYNSTQLDKELNGAKKFSSINELKYFIRDRNPFINMSAPVK